MIGRATHTLRSATSLAAGRPAYAAGVRASIATIVPLALGSLLGNPGAGTWMSLGGFSAALSDRGGSYALRARTIALLTIGGAITVTLGALVAGHLVPALIVTFIVAYVASVLRVWGAQGISIGGAMLSAYAVSLGIPSGGVGASFMRAVFISVGGLWAMMIALVLWPLRPYRPARIAVAECYRALSTYILEISEAADERHTAEWSVATPVPGITGMRAALENARSVLVRQRRGRPGSAERGERLLVLGEIADQLFGHIVAASELLSAVRRPAVHDAIHAAAVNTLRDAAATAREIATDVEDEESRDAIPVTWTGDAVRSAIRHAPTEEVDPQYEYVATILDRAAQFASAASASVQVLNGAKATRPDDASLVRTPSSEELDDEPGLSEMFRAMLSPESLIVQFALRVAVVTTIAVALTQLLSLKHGFWVTITVIVILQPYTGVTLTRAVQRVLGTVLGALVAMGLGALFHDQHAILVIATIFVACCVALLPVNYAAFSVFLTPTFVLLAEASAGDWTLAPVRIFNTLLGGALALVGARILWPSPERTRFPAHAAAALRAVRTYMDHAVERFGDRSGEASDILRSARRAVGLATVNAEESLQRALAEAHGDESVLAPALTLFAYLRRITASVAALVVARHAEESRDDAALTEFHDVAVSVLDDLADALETARAPKALPKFARPPVERVESPLVKARLERLVRQIVTLHDAVVRMNASGDVSSA